MSRTPGTRQRATGASVPAVVAMLVTALAGPLTACGTRPSASADPASDTAATDCRAQWQQVSDSLVGRDQQVDPSDLADRWTSVIATAQYYATSATGKDCGAPLAAEQDTIRAIQDWSTKLRRYDIPYRFTALAAVATDYLVGARPTPTGSPGTRPRKADRASRPPTRKQVQAALTTLQDTATAATTDMQAGWDEAVAVDLADTAAVRRTLQDLTFLAADSTPYQSCLAALTVLERARASAGS